MLIDFKMCRLGEVLAQHAVTSAEYAGDGVSHSAMIQAFAPGATAQQQVDAESALAAFDWSDAADDLWYESINPKRKTLREAAQTAIQHNQDFLAIQSPTNAEVLQQVRRLTQQNIRIIERLIQIQ